MVLGSRFGATISHRGVDVVLAAQMPLQGEDLMYFPIEDLHPLGATPTAEPLSSGTKTAG